MLTELRLQNFKGFGASTSARLRPLTLIYGQNSSGKSSLLQSLLLLKQTLDEAESPHITLLAKGGLVDLGSYSEFVHRHNRSEPLEIGVSATPSRRGQYLRWRRRAQSTLPKSVGLDFEFSYAGQPPDLRLNQLRILLGDHPAPACVWQSLIHSGPTDLGQNTVRFTQSRLFRDEPSGVMQALDLDPRHPFWRAALDSLAANSADLLSRTEQRLAILEERSARLTRDSEATPDKKGARLGTTQALLLEVQLQTYLLDSLRQLVSNPEPEALRSFLIKHTREVSLVYQNFLPAGLENKGRGLSDLLPPSPEAAYFPPSMAEVTFLATDALREALESLTYLGPLREFPERHYVYSGNVPTSVGKSGRFMPDLLMRRPEAVAVANQWLERFGIPYQLEILRASSDIAALQDVYALRLIDTTTQTSVSLLDVGFGISQVLPVIVQSVLARRKILCIEQPEIHLHPALQAELGDLFVSILNHNNQVIIETHSEHLLLRLLRRMRETAAGRDDLRLRPEDISLLYVERGSTGSQVIEIRIDARGNLLDPWPGGFFEEGFRERFA